MSGLLNIGGDKSDSSYRYKMPSIICKIEGRGNGIKTVILNMAEIAKSLHIHPEYPTKYFGIEVGAQSKFSASSDRAVVNGAHQHSDLAKIMERFIATFILCPTCKLPELKMSVKSSIKIDCAACGHNSTIKTNHKLAQYIIKNPPSTLDGGKKIKTTTQLSAKEGEDDEEGAGEVEAPPVKKKGGKREHKGKKKSGKSADDGGEANGEEGGEEEEELENGEEEEVAEVETKPSKSSKSAAAAAAAAAAPAAKSSKKDKAADEDSWFADSSKEAQAARKEAEFAAAREAAAAASSIEKIFENARLDAKESPTTTLKVFLAHTQRGPQATPQMRTNAEIHAEVKRITLAKGLDQPSKLRALVEALFETAAPSDAKAIAAFFHARASLLAHYTGDRQSCTALIACIEELFGVTHKEFLNAVPHAFKQLYDDDVLDEESLIAWFDSPAESSWLVKKDVAEQVRAKAKTFIDWLRTAAEEDDDEDDDDEDDV